MRMHPEVDDHCRRVAELCRLAGGIPVSAFDDAVEFAAYEGASLPSAIAEFLAEADGMYDPAIARGLRRLAIPRSLPDLRGRLPVLPAAALKLMRTSTEDSSVADLEKIATSDAVLAARLLGAANSAALGRSAEIRSLTQAILRLGIPLARQTLLAACFGTLFASAALAEIWQHTKAVAALAHELAEATGHDPEIAYLAGLLHDMGRLLTQRAPAELQSQAIGLVSAGFPLVYAETLVYGTDHAVLGSDLLADWRVPEEIVEAVAFHHRPEAIESVLAGILCIAEEESRSGSMPSESLSAGMRRAAAARIAGLPGVSRQISRASALFALAV